jgi:ACS family tartrate transporter-like MFS transporter
MVFIARRGVRLTGQYSIANLGGFVGPFGFGALEDATGSIYLGLSIVSGVLIISGLLVVRLKFVKTAEAAARRVVLTEDPGLEPISTHALLTKTSKGI